MRLSGPQHTEHVHILIVAWPRVAPPSEPCRPAFAGVRIIHRPGVILELQCDKAKQHTAPFPADIIRIQPKEGKVGGEWKKQEMVASINTTAFYVRV